MTRNHTYRPIPLALTMLIALFSALVALAISGGHDAQAHGTPAADHQPSQRQLAFHDGMRKLWEDHVTWTRLAIISLTTGSPDTDATVGRLLKNQADIGNAIKPFYGKAAGAQLTKLLREHILIAADLIAAAKACDQPSLSEAQARWSANADAIARFLNKANPKAWKLRAMKTMLHEHLKLTTQEAVARLQHDWAADVAAYDQIHVQALHMADMLSAGIVKQFPKRFH
jgi:hypothetical protein